MDDDGVAPFATGLWLAGRKEEIMSKTMQPGESRAGKAGERVPAWVEGVLA